MALRRACDFAASRVATQAIISFMYRAPKTVDLFHAPPEFLCEKERAAVVTLPAAGRVRLATLRAFVRAMAAQGCAVQAARLGYDRLYAFECFARAHACNDDALRALALELFAAFERSDA
jgi:hypothetical protein